MGCAHQPCTYPIADRINMAIAADQGEETLAWDHPFVLTNTAARDL